jgi:uncharacterized protein (TIGR03086 family)
MPAEPLAQLSAVLDLAESLIDGVRPEQAGLPTPCRSWDVRALVAHLVHDTRQFTVAAKGGRPDWSAPATEVDGEWAAAFRAGAAELRVAWQQAGEMNEEVDLSIGRVPRSFLANQQVAEFAVHCWDLAVATGQQARFPAEVCESALAWGKTALRPQFRGDESSGKAFGPEVLVPADAPAEDRLAAFFGRSQRSISS